MNIFGFIPGNIHLYKLAFRHKSVAVEKRGGFRLSNERLEYLGDAVLSAIIADYLFKKFPFRNEGFLTEMRAKIVSRTELNRLCEKIGLDRFIEADHSSNNLYRSIKGDTFEAFVGALYLDKGYRFTTRIILNRILRNRIDIEELSKKESNFKSRILMWAQKEKKELEYKVIEEKGSGYNKQYIVETLIEGKAFGRGQDYSIKGAEQRASEKAWNVLKEDGSIT